MTALPSPAPLSSCLTTTAVAPGRRRWMSAAAAPRRRRCGRPRGRTGSGTPASRKSRRPRSCTPAASSVGTCPVDRRLQRDRDGDLVVGDVPRLDVGRPVADHPPHLGELVGVVEQLLGHRPMRRVRHRDHVRKRRRTLSRRAPAPATSSSPAPRRPGACDADEDHLAGLDPPQHREPTQVAVLEGRDPVGVVGEQRLAEAEGRQHHQHVLGRRARGVQGQRRAQPRLQLLERPHRRLRGRAPVSRTCAGTAAW